MKILLSWSSGTDSAWAPHLRNELHPGAVGALEPMFPVCGIPTARLADEITGAGVHAPLSCIDTL